MPQARICAEKLIKKECHFKENKPNLSSEEKDKSPCAIKKENNQKFSLTLFKK